MILDFSQGKLIANSHELMVRLKGEGKITLQAYTDAIDLIAIANVITAHGGGVSWSIQLDNETQLIQLAEEMAITLKGKN